MHLSEIAIGRVADQIQDRFDHPAVCEYLAVLHRLGERFTKGSAVHVGSRENPGHGVTIQATIKDAGRPDEGVAGYPEDD
ncbi:hypothetical protein GCM10020254_30740 [Streptomyces goshikiensis]